MRSAPAAPGGCGRESAELRGDLRGADDLARLRPDEDPLVRGRPGDEEPTTARRERQAAEDPAAAEEETAIPAGEDVAREPVDANDPEPACPGREHRVRVVRRVRGVVLEHDGAA